ncbi:DUF1284 domain-containing protein [Paenibacillus sp. HB172176]|uniref:DUF1284 domain-containing protein n=1 Tax=Paenibacillus sp. HB172176 TaxID=2493690 RepID=UPI001F1139F7|nr:DUF1284 domain-containing protein [Paenibacillus sp. HB172176]
MKIFLRGHHLLCLLGFRGMGYSPAFIENMKSVHEQLRNDESSIIAIIEGPDDLCACFPANEESHCLNESVAEHDRNVLRRLGLTFGMSLPWSEALERIRGSVEAKDIETLCYRCQWRSYGVCAEGVAHIRQGRGLRPLP